MAFSKFVKLGLLSLCTQLPVSVIAQSDDQAPLVNQENDNECHNACTALVSVLGSKAYYDYGPPTGFSEGYFSQIQREVIPACVIVPGSAEDVSEAIKVINQHQCIFSCKSGGHSMFAGASNAPGGITIDLRDLNLVELSEDKQTTRVGPGNRWGEVYEKLEPLNLTVVGGRNDQVGVGGFTLGGGISFVSRRHGWALDNVRNFEVVLANGSISQVNYESHPDLYFALRGGGNNFGIVTQFDFETYPQGKVWGGQNWYIFEDGPARRDALSFRQPMPWTLSGQVRRLGGLITAIACKLGFCLSSKKFLQGLVDIILAEQRDPYAQLYVSMAMYAPLNTYMGTTCLVYSWPEINPPIFQELKALQSVYSSTRLTYPLDIYREVSGLSPVGNRQMWATLTFKVNADLLSKIMDIYVEETEPIKNVPGLLPCIVFQPINKDEISLFSKNGGNSLGISNEDGPLLLFSATHQWDNAEDDEAVRAAVENIISRASSLAKEMDLDHRYIYQNYADISQDVFAGYGEENRARLKEIQKKYDPEGVFSRLQPGYFKL